VIKYADYIIDLGPGGGSDGGNIVAEGTLHDIIQNVSSLTGRYLAAELLPYQDIC
jgi:excinuclease ABC subunit A